MGDRKPDGMSLGWEVTHESYAAPSCWTGKKEEMKHKALTARELGGIVFSSQRSHMCWGATNSTARLGSLKLEKQLNGLVTEKAWLMVEAKLQRGLKVRRGRHRTMIAMKQKNLKLHQDFLASYMK